MASGVRALLLFLSLSVAGWAVELSPGDDLPLAGRTPVVLVHGWNADPTTFNALLRQAAAQPQVGRRCKFYRFGYDWSRPVDHNAGQLLEALRGAPDLTDRPVVIVAHSMGGLVSRMLIEARWRDWDGPDRVAGLITIATPHHGSPAANLEWLTGRSKYSLLTKLFPVGVLELLGRIPILQSVQSPGGRGLGWDNYDGQMPEPIWADANPFVRQLNENLASHPLHDELLARYELRAGFLRRVPRLSAASLPGQIRNGEFFAAGSSLLAHAFRNEAGEAITSWSISDGIVPLDSACFLLPGPPIHRQAGPESVEVDLDAVRARLRRSGLVSSILAGLDHSALATDPISIGPVLETLARYELNRLLVTAGGRLVAYQPGQAAGVAIEQAPSGARLVAAPRGDRLLLDQAGRLLIAAPDQVTVPARATGPAGWRLAPDGSRTVTPDGVLAGVTIPSYARLPGLAADQPGDLLWSPDSRRLAYRGDDGALRVVDVATLEPTVATLAEVEQVAGALRPVCWTADARWLLASTGDGLRQAAFRPDGREAAMVLDRRQTVTGLVFDLDGVQRSRWQVPGDPLEQEQTLVLMAAGDDEPITLSQRASDPVWLLDGQVLAWIETGGLAAVGLRLREAIQVVELGQGRVTALAAGGAGFLLAAVEPAGGGAVLSVVDGVGGQVTELARAANTAPAGAPLASPDGRHAALALSDGTVLVSELDRGWQARVRGRLPHWLPLPAARGWDQGRRLAIVMERP